MSAEIKTFVHNGDTYQVVDFVPLGYEIWQIGRHAPEGYIPLCRPAGCQPFPGAREIERDTLKAIPCEHAGEIMSAISRGCNTVKKMEAYVARHPRAVLSERFRTVLPYMRQIKWG